MNTFNYKFRQTWPHWVIGSLSIVMGFICLVPIQKIAQEDFVEVKGHLDTSIDFRQLRHRKPYYHYWTMSFTVYEYPYHIFRSSDTAFTRAMRDTIEKGFLAFRKGSYTDSVKFIVSKEALKKMRVTGPHEYRNFYFSGDEEIYGFSDFKTVFLKPDIAGTNEKNEGQRLWIMRACFIVGTILLLRGRWKWKKLAKGPFFPTYMQELK